MTISVTGNTSDGSGQPSSCSHHRSYRRITCYHTLSPVVLALVIVVVAVGENI